jgi:hypothetical protein
MAVTQGELFISRDGGKSWIVRNNEMLAPLPDGTMRQRSIGLENTSSWGYHFDPNDPAREYIAYTDLGFARSLDSGHTWSSAVQGARWTNTFYDIAFDPVVPGRIYAAASQRHDIPHYASIARTFPGNRAHGGGVLSSDNYGSNWTTPYTINTPGALPNQVCTTIAMDPASPRDQRTLYAGIFGENEEAGVYISTDSGKSWRQTPAQPGVLPNRHVYRLRLHPKTGELYCLITGYRAAKPDFFNPEGGGIWVSGDQGRNWRHISKGSQLNRWATAFAFDPADEQVLYVAASTPQGGTGAGGVYKTNDGGKNWVQVLKDSDVRRLSGGDSYDHHMAVAVHPKIPGLVFSGTTLHGLFYSKDGGKDWIWCRDFPFANAQSISFDPRDPDRIFVTTFGAGVWKASVSKLPGR